MKKGKKGVGMNQEGRVRRWKAEKEKIRSIVEEIKKACWKGFCKTNGEKDLREVVK